MNESRSHHSSLVGKTLKRKRISDPYSTKDFIEEIFIISSVEVPNNIYSKYKIETFNITTNSLKTNYWDKIVIDSLLKYEEHCFDSTIQYCIEIIS